MGVLLGCGGSDGPADPVDDNWFAFFSRSGDAELQLYLDGDWSYRVVSSQPPHRANGMLSDEQRATIEMLLSGKRVEVYLSDSMADQGLDMGACDPSEAHPIVYSLSLISEPLVGEVGHGCWSIEPELSESTRQMLEQLDSLTQTLLGRRGSSDESVGS